MSVALTDGLLGLEATWTLNGFTMNDLEGSLPRVRFTEVTGAHSTGDFDADSDPAAGRPGEVPRRGYQRGKSVTFAGVVEAATLPTLRAAVASLTAAASLPRNGGDTTLTVSPHASWGTIALTLYGRPVAFSCPEKQQKGPGALPSPYQREFVLTFRARDARALALDDPVSASAANDTADTIAPAGTADTEPVFLVDGPAGDTLDLLHVEQARKVRFVGLPLDTGEVLTVVFGLPALRRSATIDGVDVSGYIDWTETTWWDDDAYGLAPSSQSVKVTGAGDWACSAFPAVH
jgi:hypothetical protein